MRGVSITERSWEYKPYAGSVHRTRRWPWLLWISVVGVMYVIEELEDE